MNVVASHEQMERLRERSVARLDDEAALDHIGTLVAASLDGGFARGADRAIYLLDELAKRELMAEDRSRWWRIACSHARCRPAKYVRVHHVVVPEPVSDHREPLERRGYEAGRRTKAPAVQERGEILHRPAKARSNCYFDSAIAMHRRRVLEIIQVSIELVFPGDGLHD